MKQHIVEAADGSRHVIETPDDWTQEQIVAAADQIIPKPGVMADMAKSAAIGVPKGVAALLGTPADLVGLGSNVGTWIGSKIAGIPYAEAKKRVSGGSDFPQLPTGQNIQSAVEGFTGKWYEPKTVPGRYTEKAVEAAVPGIGSKAGLAIGAVSGLGGEAAVQLTKDERARIVGSLGFGIPLGVLAATRGTIAQNTADALKNVPDAQLVQAQKLMDDARSLGTPITGAEAIARVTGKNSLQDIQRVVENSAKGAPLFQPMMNARPQANRSAFQDVLDGISPRPTNPAATPVSLTQAAQGALDSARQAGNTAARPFYDAAANQRIPPQNWNAITQDPVLVKALQATKSDPVWGVSSAAEGNVGWLDASKRWLDDKIASAKLAGENSAAMNYSQSRKDLVTRIDPAIPDYAKARSIVANNRQTVVNPMQASPVGNIAGLGQGRHGMPLSAEEAMAAQRQILMPQAPAALDPSTIQYTARTIGNQNPQALPQFTRQSLQSQFDEATQNLPGGANQWGGSRFAAQTAGNPSQRENLDALLNATGGPQARAGFDKFLQVMEAQGKRNPTGSQTEFNRQIAGDLSTQGTGGVAALAMSPFKWGSFVKDSYDRYRYGANTENMARVLTDPRSVEILKELAVTAPNSARAQMLSMTLVALGRDTQDEGTPSPGPVRGLLGVR